jgi:hypothetical protein
MRLNSLWNALRPDPDGEVDTLGDSYGASCPAERRVARNRCAVLSQLRRLCAELSEATQEAANCSSLLALVAAIA